MRKKLIPALILFILLFCCISGLASGTSGGSGGSASSGGSGGSSGGGLIIGDLIYTISNGEAKVIGCDENATEIEIPEEIDGYPVTAIKNWAFDGCRSLKKVYITNLASWCNINFQDECSNPCCNGADLYINNALAAKIVIPEGITEIKDYAFYNCKSILKVTLPDGVTSIGDYAFSQCESLTSINIPDGVMSIGNSAFSHCNSLIKINIPYGVTSIEDYVFSHCTNLVCVNIPEGVTSIGRGAFSWCRSLANITIPNTVITIGNMAFAGCRNLPEANIPSGVTSIGDDAFSGCDSLKKVYVTDLVAWLKFNFDDLYENPLNNGADLYINGVLAENIVIPSSVTAVNEWSFYNCKSIKTLVLPENLEYIKKSAFYGCSNLSKVFYEGSEAEWEDVLIYPENDSITNAEIIYNAREKVYCFNSNCSVTLPDISAYFLEKAPEIENEGKAFLGWYDNESLSGSPVSFPYYGSASTLYAAWTERTGESFDEAIEIRANGEYYVTTENSSQIFYCEFTPEITGEYSFYTSGSYDTCGYLYDSGKNQLAYNDNGVNNFKITSNLTAGNKYYIGVKNKSGAGTFALICETDCVPGTKTVCIEAETGEKIFVCVPNYIENDYRIILACYKGGRLTETHSVKNEGDTIYFVASKPFDLAKIMVWESFFNPTPVCKPETVNIKS